MCRCLLCFERGGRTLEHGKSRDRRGTIQATKLLGLVEPTDRREAAIYDFLEERVFYRLTDKGRAEVRAWEDPVRVAHPEFG